MKRKDLFRDGFRSVFQFAFAKTDDLTETVENLWKEKKKPPSGKKITSAKKISGGRKPKHLKNGLFRTLSLPPGASPDYATLCTGCNACVFSCPYNVLFPVSSEKTNKTYAFLDPNAKACHLCEDWPCIGACPEGALIPLETPSTNPKLGTAKPISENCINHKTGEKTCEACFTVCPVEKTVTFRDDHLPQFSAASCTGCGLCVEVCPTFPKAIQIKTPKLFSFD